MTQLVVAERYRRPAPWWAWSCPPGGVFQGRETGGCRRINDSRWPRSPGVGLVASLLGTTKRKDGKPRVTCGGHPLYFARDTNAGDVNGQGFVHLGEAWWVVSAAGKKVTAKP